MMRRKLPVTLVVAAAIIAAGCGGSSDGSSSGDSSGTLDGSVGPGFEIAMTETSVAPGKYKLVVEDQSTAHNFHLTGPGGVDVMTEVEEIGTKTFDVELEPGTYTFVCDPHSDTMNGTLTVG